MKKFLKAFVKHLIFRGTVPRTFPAVRIDDGTIVEKVFLVVNDNSMEISNTHSIACHSPFCLMIWMTTQEWTQFKSDHFEIVVKIGDTVCTRSYARFNRQVEVGDNLAVIVTIEKSHCYQISKFRQLLILRYFKNKNTMALDKIYSAIYSYPRRVIVVSFVDNSGYNIFPMDFQCHLKGAGIYILGLRTTNITLPKLVDKKRIVISDTDQASLEIIYQLGSHHSSTPPPLETLPFKFSYSEVLKFPVPDFSSAYVEVELFENYELGSHMLLIGRVINTVKIRPGKSKLYHIHFIHSVSAQYKREN